jgi:hypothetical protein
MTLEPTLTATVTAGSVTFEFHVENVGTEPIGLWFSSGQTASLTVHEAAGSDDPVWEWPQGQMFTQMIREPTLQPGEAIEEEYTWDNASAGEYVAEAELAAKTNVTAETTFSV